MRVQGQVIKTEQDVETQARGYHTVESCLSLVVRFESEDFNVNRDPRDYRLMVSEKALYELRGGGQRMNLSFAGCGFLGIYHVGVASCFKEYAPQLVADKIAGASAGAIAACALLTGACLGESTSYVLGVVLKARSRALGPFHPGFNIVQFLREGLYIFLPPNAHEVASNRLFISLTRVSDRKNVLVSQFDTFEDLVQALICSSFVPLWSGLIPPKYKGVRYVDGGMSDNIPILDENTITVSPFAGESDICPNDNTSNFMHVHLAGTSIQLSSGNLFRAAYAFYPPHPDVLANMCRRGFDDALEFLKRNRLIGCTKHLSVQTAITPGDRDSDEEQEDQCPNDNCHDNDCYDNDGEEEEGPETEDDSSDMEVDFHIGYSSSDEDEREAEDGDVDWDEEDGDEEGDMRCYDCHQRQHVALIDSLPAPVLVALQGACDSVNKGLLAPVYNLRAFKVISLLTAPMLLPVDVAMALGQKLMMWVPYMPSDMQWFVSELSTIIGELYDIIQSGRHRYSARFTCQLAITEVQDFMAGAVTSLTDQRDYHFSHRRESVGRSAPHQHHLHHHHHHHHPLPHPHPHPHRQTQRSRNVNVGFSVDISSGQYSALKCVTDLRQDILDDCEHVHEASPTASNEDLESLGLGSGNLGSEDIRKSGVTEAYDSFDNCLHIANQMDALLSFYYAEEGDEKTVKVTEIFPLDDPRGPSPSFHPSARAWENMVQGRPDVEEQGPRSRGLRPVMSEQILHT